jgi:16S rRNA (cytosine967-C5)-methyltransferase
MIAPARRAAYQILIRIATTDAHSDDLLCSPQVDALSPLDRNLTTTLVLGTLRWQLSLDARIRELLARPDAKLSPETAAALRIGAYQLLFLERVPPHAVIHDSVELVKRSKEPGAAGMVNAVLRNLQRSGLPRGHSEAAAAPESPAAVAASFAHPSWMVERWARCYGRQAAEAICRWDQQPSGVTLRLPDPDAGLPALETEPGFFLTNARRLLRGDPGRTPAFREGRLRIQDEASQLVAEIAAAVAPNAGRILDTCAAPGGKTAILAERLPSADITAVDVSARRLETMRLLLPPSTADRLHYQAADAATLQLEPNWNLILCDVPCSGTGTMARNPEIRLRVTKADLERQQARQRSILLAALRGLKPGGRLVYSTCSLEPEENQQVVDSVLRETPGMTILPVSGILDQLTDRGTVTAEGRERLRTATEGLFLRTLPGMHPCDGFFAAVLEKPQQTS